MAGPSGNGKSILLNMLGALDRPTTSRKVYLDGCINHLWKAKG